MYVDSNGLFNRIYAIGYTCEIKNHEDLTPLQSFISRFQNDGVTVCVRPHLRIFEIFSTTLYKSNADSCPKLENLMKKNNMEIYATSQLPKLDELNFILRQSNEIAKKFPQNFILKQSKVVVLNNKILLKYKLSDEAKQGYTNVVNELNEFFGTNKKPTFSIVLALINKEDFELSRITKETMSLLAPNKIFVKGPRLSEHNHVDSFFDYKM